MFAILVFDARNKLLENVWPFRQPECCAGFRTEKNQVHNLAWCPGPMLKNRQLKVREEKCWLNIFYWRDDRSLNSHKTTTRTIRNVDCRALRSNSDDAHTHSTTDTRVHIRLSSCIWNWLAINGCFCRTVYGLCSVHRFLWNLHSRDWQPTIIVNASGPTNQIVSLFALSLSLSVCTLHRRQ